MSNVEIALVISAVTYGAIISITFVWGHITYSTTIHYPMLKAYELEKRTGARAMILAPVWPLFVLMTWGKPWGRVAGRFVGRVWKDSIR